MTAKRNQHGLNEHEKAETEQMEAAGFEWNPGTNGAPRWDNWPLLVTALREHWMRDVDWDKRRAEKVAEAARSCRFEELPLGTRFRWRKHVDSRRRVYVKLDVDMVIEWKGPQPVAVLQSPIPISDLAPVDREVVEPFEPFADLVPGELENLPGFPEVWTALADWHSCQSTMAEAADYIESSRWHDGREETCKAKAAELMQRRENG